jgi:fluoride exporter
LNNLFLIASGGALGALARFGISKFIGKIIGGAFPWGTLTANFVGLLIIGFLFEIFERSILPQSMRYLITIGFLGALTTFSTYGLESLLLMKNGQMKLALFNILLSNAGGLICVGVGMLLSRFLIKTLAWA